MTSRFPKLTARPLAWSALALLWIVATVAGLGLLAQYANTPGAAAAAPCRWPANPVLSLDIGRPTLLFFAHPLCPCTRASLEELQKLLARRPAGVAISIIFFEPRTAGDQWSQSDLCATAATIPNVRIIRDTDGTLARCFGVFTSGQALLYSNRGDLLFRGGLTLARGHEGDNVGRAAIETILAGGVPVDRAPVFGCPLALQGEPQP